MCVPSRVARPALARRSGGSCTSISSSPLREVVDMAAIKLGKLPDRTPVKLTLSILPDLKQALDDYASLYSATYGEEEPVTELIPQMPATFLASDRNFVTASTPNKSQPERSDERRVGNECVSTCR